MINPGTGVDTDNSLRAHIGLLSVRRTKTVI